MLPAYSQVAIWNQAKYPTPRPYSQFACGMTVYGASDIADFSNRAPSACLTRPAHWLKSIGELAPPGDKKSFVHSCCVFVRHSSDEVAYYAVFFL